jgi:hypothetical protein
MRTVRVAAAALNQTPLDWEGNKARIIRAIEFARAERANVLVLPELSITGYGCEDAFFMPGLIETATAVLGEILPTTKGLVVAVGLPVTLRANPSAFMTVLALAIAPGTARKLMKLYVVLTTLLTPRTVSTSAAPDLDDRARLPCFATGTPQAATTSEAAVETFHVPIASPPVPTMSMACWGG